MDRMFYMTPQDAKDYGLIDQLLQSTKELVKPVPVLT
jgi:ATP-dependent Clp protease, protease subunit